MATLSGQKLSSVTKALQVLDLPTPESPWLRVDDIAMRLELKRSTAYRYVRELSDAGLLSQIANGVYGLGPRVIELERQLTLSDPLYLAGAAVMRNMPTDDRALLLHNLYQDRVLCIYHEGPDALRLGRRKIQLKRARGMPFPLFQGAASLAILAYMKPHRVRDTYLRRAPEIAEIGLGDSWEGFRRQMSAIRKQGFALSNSHITNELSAIAVPILLTEPKQLLGSLTATYPTAALAEEKTNAIAQELHAAAARIASTYMAGPSPFAPAI